jgi:hypothetical protein
MNRARAKHLVLLLAATTFIGCAARPEGDQHGGLVTGPGQPDGGGDGDTGGTGTAGSGQSDCTGTLEQVQGNIPIASGGDRCPERWEDLPTTDPCGGSGGVSTGECGGFLMVSGACTLDSFLCIYDATSHALVAAAESTDYPEYCGATSSCISAGPLPAGVKCDVYGFSLPQGCQLQPLPQPTPDPPPGPGVQCGDTVCQPGEGCATRVTCDGAMEAADGGTAGCPDGGSLQYSASGARCYYYEPSRCVPSCNCDDATVGPFGSCTNADGTQNQCPLGCF